MLSAVCGAQPFDSRLFSEMRWRLVGPFRGGWATCAEGIPDDTATYYFGAAGGGVWRTEDAGRTWAPIFEHESAASVGAIAIAPSDPRMIYVGTGQVQARYDIASGDGVFRSEDGGKSWRHLGLSATRAIGRILVDPGNPDVVLVAALGHIYGANRERGVFRTADGGRTWSQTLFVDENTGGVDLAIDPESPSVVYAALWQARNYPWLSYFKPVAGPGSGVYKSTDAGLTWKRLSGGGWPSGVLGRIGLAAARGGRVWALVDAAPAAAGGIASPAGLYRSDDGGATWARINATPDLANSYLNRVTADPRDPQVVYIMGQSIRRSEDGGKTLRFFKGAPGGDDYHLLWINPKHPEFMVTASDQGTVVTVSGGKSWSDWYNQPTGQFYHVATDNRFPYWIYSGQQDSGTAGIASRGGYGAVTYREWHPVGGEERGWDIPDPSDPLIVYGSGLGGTVTRFDTRTGQVRNVSPSVESTYGQRPTGLKFRYSWISPLLASPRPPHALYFGSQYLLRSADGGSNWEKISPDLSGAEPGAAGCEGEVDLVKARSCGFGVIFSIALSPTDDREIWVGTDDGLIRLTRDGGKTWQNVTPRELTIWGKVASLDVSVLEPGTAYAAVDGHRLDDFSPHVFRTHDYGRTWKQVIAGLPASRFVTVVRADPVRRGLLYAGTDGGVFVSFDDGGHWQPLQLNLPTAWVGDLAIHGSDLIAATQGRAIWILDDVSPLRQFSAAVATKPAHLFAPAAAIRVRRNENRDTPLPPETPIGENPPAGAVIDYVLRDPAKEAVRIEILDSRGEIVRAFSSDDPPERLNAHRYFADEWVRPPAPPSKAAGHHRFVWDLRYPRPPSVRYGYTIAAVYGEDTPIEPEGPLASPGSYTVRLTVDRRAQEQPLLLTPDPRVNVSAEILASKLDLERSVVEAMRASFQTLGQVRSLRDQLQALQKRAGAAGLVGEMQELDRKAVSFDGSEVEATGRRAAGGEGFSRLNSRFGTILSAVDSADAAPTAIQTQTFDQTRKAFEDRVRQWKELREGDLASLNAKLSRAGLPPLEFRGGGK
jgi:photosystem II stability/assembly factor-like uncharacterized protein